MHGPGSSGATTTPSGELDSPTGHAVVLPKGQCLEIRYHSVKKQAVLNIGANLAVQFTF